MSVPILSFSNAFLCTDLARLRARSAILCGLFVPVRGRRGSPNVEGRRLDYAPPYALRLNVPCGPALATSRRAAASRLGRSGAALLPYAHLLAPCGRRLLPPAAALAQRGTDIAGR